MSQPPSGPNLCDRAAAGGAFRTRVAQGEQLLVGFIGADPALGRFDPFLNLGQVLVGDPWPASARGGLDTVVKSRGEAPAPKTRQAK